MWPFSGLSLATASFWFDAANAALLASLVVGVLSTFAIVRLGNVKEWWWDKDREGSRGLIAQAGASADEARKETAFAKLEQQRLQSESLELQLALKPRRMSFFGWTDDVKKVTTIADGLKKFSGVKAFLQVVPDFEAKMYAQDIANVLTSNGWQVSFVSETQSHMSDLSFPEGLTIFTLSDGKTNTEAGTALWTALLDTDVLQTGTGEPSRATAFHEILDKPRAGYPSFDTPVTGVFIRIGLKPTSEAFLELQKHRIERQERDWNRHLVELWKSQGGRLQFGVEGHGPVDVTPTPDGNLIAVNPAEQSLLPKKKSLTLVFPNGAMMRSAPPDGTP